MFCTETDVIQYLINSVAIFNPQALKAEVFYWKVEDPKAFSPKEFPTFWHCPPFPVDRGAHTRYYGIPVFEYPGLIKVSFANYCALQPQLMS